jgi:uncharacterized protein YceH (UPF0502 family)
VLQALIERELVACMGRRPGQKEERYAQLLGGNEDANPAAVPTPGDEPRANSVTLEQRVAQLERELAELQARLGGGGRSPSQPGTAS